MAPSVAPSCSASAGLGQGPPRRPPGSTNIQRPQGRLVNDTTGLQGCPMSSRRASHTPRGTRKVAEGRGATEGSMMTFVVRLTLDKVGRITGVVEKVKTGRKARVESVDA